MGHKYRTHKIIFSHTYRRHRNKMTGTIRRFKLDGKILALTYPQNDTEKETAMDRIKEHFKENLNCCIVSQEKHKDDNNHLHIYIKLNNRFTTTKKDYLDFIADKHGDYKAGDVGWIRYIIKDKDYITYNIDANKYIQEINKHTTRESKGIFKQITDNINNETTYKDILRQYPDICLQHGNKIKQYIADYKTLHKPDYRNWEMEVEYHYGKTGTGKSKLAFKDFHPDTHYQLRKSNGENNVWWDGYEGQEIVIIDDFTPRCYRLQYMLNLLDRYPMRIDTKGGHTQMISKKIIITSNYKPKDLYTNTENTEHKNALLRRITYFKQYGEDDDTEDEATYETKIHDWFQDNHSVKSYGTNESEWYRNNGTTKEEALEEYKKYAPEPPQHPLKKHNKIG